MIKKLMLPLLMVGFMLGFSACGSDDESNDVASQIVGTYASQAKIALGSTTVPPDMSTAEDPTPATINMVRESDNTLKLELKDLKVGNDPINLSIKGVVVTLANNEHKLTYNGPISFVLGGMTMNVTATLTGSVKNGVFGSDIHVSVPDLNMTVQVRIDGNKK